MRRNRHGSVPGCWILAAAFALAPSFGCDSGEDAPPAPGPEPVTYEEPVADPQAAAAAFRLFYRERVDRAILAYNRFGLFGDSVFATTIGGKAVAKQGSTYEIVPGPTDNNLIGTSAYAAWHAYKVFRTRTLALTLVRMFEGLVFVEQVTGIPGLTVREALPGWTRVMDGVAGTVTRTRFGEPVQHPDPPDPALEAEVLSTFFDGVRITYRENPGEYMFTFMPAARVSSYAITYSIDERPRFIRSSNCCRSTMRTPEGYAWTDAYWGNHNSRDNLPDLLLGILAALDASGDETVDPDVRRAARRAVEAGRRVGDRIESSGGNLMTVDEYHPYGELTVSGTRRPHGDPENQDLGSMSSCPMSYLARAVSGAGLDLPFPELPQPGEIEEMLLRDLLGIEIDVPLQYCHDVNDAYFATSYGTLLQTEPLGLPWLDILELLDILSPGLADSVIGSFQNDYDDIAEATLGVVLYARITGRTDLEARAQEALLDQTNLQRRFADVIYGRIDPDQQARQRYEAAVFDAVGGLPPIEEDFGDFSVAEGRIATIESMLSLEDTTPQPLKTDAEIRTEVEEALAREKLASVVQRYRDTYGETPPIRRAGDGYEARTSADPAWRPVENPSTHGYKDRGLVLLQEIPICVHAPQILDCTWARIGCGAADLTGDGAVDEQDVPPFEDALSRHRGLGERSCRPSNGWCEGADLDRTGEADDLDRAFLEAAQGCHYAP